MLKRLGLSRFVEWCANCWVARMKSIAFRADKNGNGYVRTAFVGNAQETGASGKMGLLIVGILLTVTATFVCLMLVGK